MALRPSHEEEKTKRSNLKNVRGRPANASARRRTGEVGRPTVKTKRQGSFAMKTEEECVHPRQLMSPGETLYREVKIIKGHP